MAVTKITTCCYCGTRAALVLRGEKHHELSCSTCGAPLQALKMLPIPRETQPSRTPQSREKPRYSTPERKVRKPKKKKKFKSFKRRLWDEFWDEIEDLFD